MQNIKLRYGTETETFAIPDGTDGYTVTDPAAMINPALFRQRLFSFFETCSLKTPVAVVVADKTRLCGYADYLPVLLEVLENTGASPADITIYIAYGTHPRQSEETALSIYGSDYRRYRFVHHDCTDKGCFADLGITSRGTPIMVRRDIVEAGFLITFGAVSHHYFAGFGGGRKLVFPGLGYRPAIYHNHGLFLNRESGVLDPGCLPGKMSGNPLAEDLAEVESFHPADLAIHGLLDSHGQVCDLLVGSGQNHFRTACETQAAICEVKSNRQYELVLASCGGHPKDINFIQSHKAVHHAAAFVQDGGELILLARCPDGIGSQTFLPWFQMGGPAAAFARLAENYSGNGGTALSMMAKTARIRIRMVSELNEETKRQIGVTGITPADARKRVCHHRGSLAVIPNASLVVKKNP